MSRTKLILCIALSIFSLQAFAQEPSEANRRAVPELDQHGAIIALPIIFGVACLAMERRRRKRV